MIKNTQEMVLVNKPPIKFYDTSALLGGADLDENSFISTTVFDEVEHIKTSATKDPEVKFQARNLVRKLMEENKVKTEILSERDIQKIFKKNDFLAVKNDSRIICEALLLNKKYDVTFITQDACQYLIVKNRFPELKVQYFAEERQKTNLWKGYKELVLSQEELSELYSNPEVNTFNFVTHEYATVALKDNPKEIVDVIKWDGQRYGVVKYKKINSDFFGIISPRNYQQEMFFDLLQDTSIPIKVCRGGYGPGKTFIALANALNEIQKGHAKKIVFIRNNVEVADSKALGALPGSQYDKLLPFMMPLADHLGSEEVLHSQVEEGIIEPVHVGFLRGRNFNDSILIVDEAENLTDKIVKLIIGRIGEGSSVIFLGDEHQTDSAVFAKNSGLAALTRSLKGNPLFGTVELQKSERSHTAELAEFIK